MGRGLEQYIDGGVGSRPMPAHRWFQEGAPDLPYSDTLTEDDVSLFVAQRRIIAQAERPMAQAAASSHQGHAQRVNQQAPLRRQSEVRRHCGRCSHSIGKYWVCVRFLGLPPSRAKRCMKPGQCAQNWLQNKRKSAENIHFAVARGLDQVVLHRQLDVLSLCPKN